MFEDNKRGARVLTCVESVDKLLCGGFAPGSTVLLLSELGCGEREFMQTSLRNYSRVFNNSSSDVPFGLAANVFYFSHKPGRDNLFAKDCAGITHINLSEDIAGADGCEMLCRLTSRFENIPPKSLVFVDSLTPYATYCKKDEAAKEIVSFVYKTEKIAKQKDAVFVLSLAKNSLPTTEETEISDAFDAVLVFDRLNGEDAPVRLRRMYIEKYDDVLSTLGGKGDVMYYVSVSQEHGFEISALRRVP